MLKVAGTGVKWEFRARDSVAEARLQSELGISAVAAAVLVSRGYFDPEEADRFLNPKLSDLNDPSLLPDYDAARDAILGARERKETIFIHGDYDVDGVTSAALLSRFLRNVGCEVVTHVPHRMKEGYGIHASAVDAAAESGAKLFLTCDCGVAALEQVQRAKEAGMNVVVTDHHSIGDELPQAAAVMNPHRSDSKYPFPELSGAGVVFKLCEGLTAELGHDKSNYYRAFLDLAALGTIADVMPLVGENRIIAKHGLARLADTKKPGLKALMQEAKIAPGTALGGYHVGFLLGPRLNAAGRVDDAALALRLLLTTDNAEALSLARTIEQKNFERREEQQKILAEAIEIVEADQAHLRNIIIVAKEGWHSGIIGIVAGRLVELFRRPTFVMSISPEGVCKGSARSIPKFHLADVIHAHPELVSGGGHAMAAGCSFPLDKMADVIQAFDIYASERLTPEDFVPVACPDVVVTPEEVTRKAVEELSLMEPFGCANPTPLLAAQGLTLAEVAPTKKPEHVRTLLRSSQTTVAAMGFNMGERISAEMIGEKIDVLFQAKLDEWRGTVSLKWHLQDLRETSPFETEPEPALSGSVSPA